MSLDRCIYCNEEIGPDDLRGKHSMSIMHYECSMRSVVGSVAHQEGRCSCHGGVGEDDPTLSRRANAKLACQLYHLARVESQ